MDAAAKRHVTFVIMHATRARATHIEWSQRVPGDVDDPGHPRALNRPQHE